MLLEIINTLQTTAVILGIILLGFFIKVFKYNRYGFAFLTIFLFLDVFTTAYDLISFNELVEPYQLWPILIAIISGLYPLLLRGYLWSLEAIKHKNSDWLKLIIFPVFFSLVLIFASIWQKTGTLHQQLFETDLLQYSFYGAISSIYCLVFLYPLCELESDQQHVRSFVVGIKWIVFTYVGNTLSFLILATVNVEMKILLGMKVILFIAWMASVYYLLISVLYFLPFGRVAFKDAFNQSEVKNGGPKVDISESENETGNAEDSDIGEQNDELINQFDSLLNENLIYKQPKIQLSDIADRLETSEKVLRVLLRNKKNESFKNLIYQKRVEHIQNQLNLTKEKPNFLDLAYEAGFNSKATFNRVFKQKTGLNPSEYFEQRSKLT